MAKPHRRALLKLRWRELRLWLWPLSRRPNEEWKGWWKNGVRKGERALNWIRSEYDLNFKPESIKPRGGWTSRHAPEIEFTRRKRKVPRVRQKRQQQQQSEGAMRRRRTTAAATVSQTHDFHHILRHSQVRSQTHFYLKSIDLTDWLIFHDNQQSLC